MPWWFWLLLTVVFIIDIVFIIHGLKHHNDYGYDET